MPRHGQLDEFRLIGTLLAPLTGGAPGAFGLTDDAAVIPSRDGHDLVATTDAMICGVHYLPDDPPADIGRKLLRVNLSDLAGMGAAPEAYLLTLGLTEATPLTWIEAFVAGLAEDQAAFGIRLVGGDTVRAPTESLFSVTALGWVKRGREIRRRGAHAGDNIYVSGSIGDAVLGLAIATGTLSLEAEAESYLLGRLRRPAPRIGLGLGLVGLASAGLDVSDGLISDLGHLCTASGVGAVVEAGAVPLSPPAARQVTDNQQLLTSLITGGDDYELVFTAPPANGEAVERLGKRLALRLTRIGRVIAGQGVQVIDDAGHEVEIRRRGYAHFSGPS